MKRIFLALLAIVALAGTAVAQGPGQYGGAYPGAKYGGQSDMLADLLFNAPPVPFGSRVLSVQNSGDTNDCSSGAGSYRAYNLTYSIPANTMVNQRLIRVTAHYRLTTGTVPTGIDVQMKIGGTIVAHVGPNTPTASITNLQYTTQWLVQATAAPGAAVATESAMVSNANGIGSATVNSDTAQPVNLATNGALAITIENRWASACTGTNQIKLSQFIVEALN